MKPQTESFFGRGFSDPTTDRADQDMASFLSTKPSRVQGHPSQGPEPGARPHCAGGDARWMLIFPFSWVGGVNSHNWTENGLASTGCLPVPVSCSDSRLCHFACSHCGRTLRGNPDSTKSTPRSASWSWLPNTWQWTKTKAISHPPNPPQAAGELRRGHALSCRTRAPGPWLSVGQLGPEHRPHFLLCNNCKRVWLRLGPAAPGGGDVWLMQPPGQPLSGTCWGRLQTQTVMMPAPGPGHHWAPSPPPGKLSRWYGWAISCKCSLEEVRNQEHQEIATELGGTVKT